MFMELIGNGGTSKRTQGTVRGVDKSNINIKIDFTKSWEAKVTVGDYIFLDLGSKADVDEKNE